MKIRCHPITASEANIFGGRHISDQINTTTRLGGSAVRASASQREGPEFCPQPVYKRHYAEKFRLNHRVPQIHWDRRARKICGVQSPVDRQKKVLVLTNIALIFCVFSYIIFL